MMPVFIYCVLASHSPFLWSELEFMKDFLGDEGCRGALGYTWVTFHSALTFILTRFAGLEPQVCGGIAWGGLGGGRAAWTILLTWGPSHASPPPPHTHKYGLGVCIWMHPVNGTGNSPVSGTADPRSSQTGQVIRGLH